MDVPMFYPVFENGQVLTSALLNDIIDYLEPQDRLTRSRLVGVGIVCGLKPDWDAGGRTLKLSRGVAVTSEGHLIAEDETVFDRVRPYTVPIPSAPTATTEEKAKARYPFLFAGNTQRPAFELLPTDYQPAPGEPAPIPLTDQFVADKTVMLFLEANLESLKNCDVNDCSDKGSEMNQALRRLLVTRANADKMIEEEEAIAGKPVDRATHPRLALSRLAIERINPAGAGIDTLPELYSRTVTAAGRCLVELMPAMRDAWDAYKPLLQGLYPAGRFPDGPIPTHHLVNMVAALAETPSLVQYFHGGTHDILRSYNEFLECAAVFDAECSPDPARFPKHVLAGDVAAVPVAYTGAPRTFADYQTYDPLAATGGPAPEGPPAPRRHHFVPAPAVDAGSDKLAELQALFSRMVLLPQTYATRGLLDAAIQLTPSRDGAAPLGERAIPFFYRFERSGSLFANWSWRKARANLYDSVFSYPFTAAAKAHPLLFRQDGEDFIRIEGIVGKPLGSTMLELIEQKRKLGVSFSIQPVWIGVSSDSKANAQAKERASRAMRQLLACRMRDLDVIFLMIMSGLFAFMVWLVQLLGRLDATKTGRKPPPASTTPPPAGGGNVLVGTFAIGEIAFLNLDRVGQSRLKQATDRTLAMARLSGAPAVDTVRALAANAGDTALEKVAVASIFDRVRDNAAGGELFDRVRVITGEFAAAADRDTLLSVIYPAVALMARAEEMMKVASARSIADFDEDRFDTALSGFANAYEAYAAKAETDNAKVPREIADANAAILSRRSFVASMTAQLNSAGITAELNKRLEAMLNDTTFSGFARLNPGMEHKAGVPAGGTFVMVYGSRRDLSASLREALDELGDGMATAFSRLLPGNPPAVAADRAIKAIEASSKPRSDDILDEFVVLADFCLPYLCCDGDCSDEVIDRRIGRKEGIVLPLVSTTPTPTPAPTPPTPAPPVTTPPTPTPPPTPAPPTPTPERPTPTDPVRPIPVDPTRPNVTTGTVEIGVFKRGAAGGRDTALARSTLITTNLSTNRSTEQPLTTATQTQTLRPGKYAFVAVADTTRSAPVEIEVLAGETQKVKLVVP